MKMIKQAYLGVYLICLLSPPSPIFCFFNFMQRRSAKGLHVAFPGANFVASVVVDLAPEIGVH